nr:MAG TPA: hypothetical protein [Caudoviricetes sp.]
MHGLAMARLSSIGRAMALRRDAQQRRCSSRRGKGYEVNCCAVAAYCDLPRRSGTEKHRQARRRNGREKR